ncbi:hypothetical protein ScPMuIL_018481 [Solemya velum]
MATACVDRTCDVVSEEEIRELEYYIKKHGVKRIDEVLKQKVHAWKFVQVNIGIMGECATGKSTFINRIRGLNDWDQGAAEVGTGDVTRSPRPYRHPRNDSLVLWDLPGVGTPLFPKNEQYLKRIHFDRYDFFLIFSDGSFSETDSWLARQIARKSKRFFFVRTKVDDDMKNVRGDEGSVIEEDVLKRIHNDCQRNFRLTGLTDVQVFIVSHFETDKWDFELLLHTVCSSLPEIKRSMMMLSIGPLSRNVIKEKRKALQRRAYTVSLLSGVAGAIPIPGLDLAADASVLLEEITHYLKTFGLDSDSLKHLANKTGKKIDYYVNTLNAGKLLLPTKKLIIDTLVKYATEHAAESVAKQFVKLLPIIGQIISGSVSYGTTLYLLLDTIQKLEADAIQVFDEVLRCTT